MGIFSLVASLPGCQQGYSSSVKYKVREDPLVLKGDKLDEETFLIDSPGQFPLFTVADLEDPRNPLFKKNQDSNLFKSEHLRDPKGLADKDRQLIQAFLDERFGTPANPQVVVRFVNDEEAEDSAKAAAFVETLKVDKAMLAKGRDLYRIHCLHCHGVSGDGRGVTAKWVNPHPRDYRQGMFKFQSVDQTEGRLYKPRREDLYRTIHQGIEGTSMPSFALLHNDELEALVSYVVHLALRGETEFNIIWTCFDFEYAKGLTRGSDYQDDGEFTKEMGKKLQVVANNWVAGQTDKLKIDVTANQHPVGDAGWEESVKRGQKIFLGEVGKESGLASCVSCHLDYGRKAKYRYDSWGTLVRPNNLTQGVYRGGRRAADVFNRIHSGINGVGMPAFGKNLKGQQIWDVVNFVQALPYPAMRAKAGIALD